MTISSILFDLDGTLLDTAPDLQFALNTLLSEHNLPLIPIEKVRPYAGHGSRELLKIGFNLNKTDERYLLLQKQFMQIYHDNIIKGTTFFTGMDRVLDELDILNIPWGIVTNKPEWLTSPLIKKIDLHHRTTCVISGDTFEQKKPHPKPVLHACELLGATPAQTIFIGDTNTDIAAGKNAGTKTMAALYGYIHPETDPQTWDADIYINEAIEILQHL